MRQRFLVLSAICLTLALTYPANPVAAQQKDAKKPIQLRVLLPQADAELVIGDKKVQQSGTTRRFASPPMESGKEYSYTVTATWKPNGYTQITRTRKIIVRAGQELEVDLRKPDKQNPDSILIDYVPTPDEVVQAMCKLADVTKNDIVYDLGCGDGRIVISAVRDYGAKRGVGIDIDPERIKESKENAKQSGVQERLEFRTQDVLKIQDLSEATVVMLYMGEDVNLRLRPILQKSLKPGARIVSHQFLMGDWKPEKTIQVTDNDGIEYDLHLWKIGQPEKPKQK